MRQNNIKGITRGGKRVEFKTFRDSCLAFVYVPVVMGKASRIELAIKHPYE
jgi:hypothetical protein